MNEQAFNNFIEEYQQIARGYREARRLYEAARRAAEAGDWMKAGALREQARYFWDEAAVRQHATTTDFSEHSTVDPPDPYQGAELEPVFQDIRQATDAAQEADRAIAEAQRRVPAAEQEKDERGYREGTRHQARKRRTAAGLGIGVLALAGAFFITFAQGGGLTPPVRALGDAPLGFGAWTWGEPHLLSFDGLQVDFQAVGEFVLIRSEDGDLEVQVRQQPVAESRTVSLNTAVAANIAGDRISIDAAEVMPLRIEGEPSTVTLEGTSLSNGGQISYDGVFYTLTWPDGSVISVPVWDYDPRGLGVRASLADARSGTIEGLLGDADGDPENDLTAANGTALGTADVSFDDLYHTWGDSWRVTLSDSLFDYGPGESSETFTDLDFPDEVVTLDSLSEEARDAASRTCREAGVRVPALLGACILDVSMTGTDEFAEGTAGLQAAWMSDGAATGAGEAHLEVTGTTEDSIDLSFDLDGSSNPPDGNFMTLSWRNDDGQQMTIGTGRFTGTRHGVMVQLQLFADRVGYSHDAFGDQCDVALTTATASRVEGSLSCTFSDVAVKGSFSGSF